MLAVLHGATSGYEMYDMIPHIYKLPYNTLTTTLLILQAYIIQL